MEDTIGKPLSPYGVTKYADELFAANFAATYGIEVIGLRYFNVFGRRQDPDGPYAAVIPKFIKLLKNHEAPVINGDGTNSRDFTYIENVLAANHLAALASGTSALNQVYNVACGEQTSLNHLYELLQKYISPFDRAISGIKPGYGPGRAGDIPHSLASVEKAERLLGYLPIVGVEEGIKQSVEWFWDHL
jgi:UDP-N-acetylglucosamine 4-epimerase